ncbi:DNA mismatch repair endonuclease MutL [Peribacillus saganii]|uniref:DNA mismatch repair protein MutL n=1 Tax=Peribacillus saganii TaxID=2303992 RepID=A0A372LU87_9BACI|nr:DNA mismatch repair endonuclease MutL [Peribacillus saganii]RFU71372.1 DNA mismatch repair endonuclease MutL [Peribacillus saganii]
MAKIIQLDEMLANKIAAGEVVERPASVVKELVENAIDAGSSVIEIHVEEAGLAMIRILDNGNGIAAEDVPTAFKRHATSKIKDENDLFRIRTLGFRGEALPSIASVSRLEIKTSTGEEAGTRLVIEGGIIKVHEPGPSRRGTDITVSDLFYNTPARLKYMKTIHTELGNISDVVNRLALANPGVSLTLIHNGKRLLKTNGSGDVLQVLAAIYGYSMAKKMVPIQEDSLDYRISGYVTLPELTRASRNYISLMVNGRFIKSYPLANAIMEGFHTLLPVGRYPIALISIEMDPILVDVNVHPSKMEVRLSKEAECAQIITSAIKQAFKSVQLIPSGPITPKAERPKSEQAAFELDHLPAEDKNSNSARADSSVYESPSTETTSQASKRIAFDSPAESSWSVDSTKLVQPSQSIPDQMPVGAELEEDYNANDGSELEADYSPNDFTEADTDSKIHEAVPKAYEQPASSSRVPVLYPIGQMHGTYILAQNSDGLYIIDQHAAQERIKYEFFAEKLGKVENELQEMLVPITLEFSQDECLKIEEYRHELERVGVFLEEFGHLSYIVRSHPQWFPKGEEQKVLEEMIEQLLLMKKVDIRRLREEAAILMSCKGSIKANRHLRNDEIQSLLDELRQTSDPFTCPHGRPIIIHYSTYDMEKMFKRVM